MPELIGHLCDRAGGWRRCPTAETRALSGAGQGLKERLLLVAAASFHGPRIQTLCSSGVVRVAGMPLRARAQSRHSVRADQA
jgi:hypothetical protein